MPPYKKYYGPVYPIPCNGCKMNLEGWEEIAQGWKAMGYVLCNRTKSNFVGRHKRPEPPKRAIKPGGRDLKASGCKNLFYSISVSYFIIRHFLPPFEKIGPYFELSLNNLSVDRMFFYALILVFVRCDGLAVYRASVREDRCEASLSVVRCV